MRGIYVLVHCSTAGYYSAHDKISVPRLEYEPNAALSVAKQLGLRQPLYIHRFHFAWARDSESG
jgi:hypothetical protein